MLTFFEKPGCQTNRLQKQLLNGCGVAFAAANLLSEPWSSGRLRPFFSGLEVSQWFNPSAPAIKNGELDIERLAEDEALALMVEQPILIRRPLLEFGTERTAGFSWDWLFKVGLISADAAADSGYDETARNLQACSRAIPGHNT